MNTPTKRIFYLFEPKFAKNEPQTKVWGSLTCKSQFLRLAESVSCAFAAGCAHVRAVCAGCATGRRGVRTRSHAFAAASRLPTRRRAAVLLDAGLLLGALDSSHLLLGKPNGTVIFSVVRSGTAVVTQVGTSCFQRRHVV